MTSRNFLSLAQESEQSLAGAVRTTIQTYTSKMENFGGPCVDDSQKLEDFLKMKKVLDTDNHNVSASGSSLFDCHGGSKGTDMVEYDVISVVNGQGMEIDHACYLLLPSGSCYGPRTPPSGSSAHRSTFSERTVMKQMRECAAEVALMNCIFNECPSRKITPDFIKQAVQHAEARSTLTSNRLMPFRDHDAAEGYRFVLEYMLDKSMMQYQELTDILTLITWSGVLFSMRKRGCCRQDVLDYCASVKLTDGFRSELSMYLVDKEEEEGEGFVEREMRQSEDELMTWRMTGRELRFPYEKRRICLMALDELDQYQYGGSEGMYPVDDEHAGLQG